MVMLISLAIKSVERYLNIYGLMNEWIQLFLTVFLLKGSNQYIFCFYLLLLFLGSHLASFFSSA